MSACQVPGKSELKVFLNSFFILKRSRLTHEHL